VHNYKSSPIQWYQNRFYNHPIAFMAKSCAQSDVQKRDGQTDRQKDSTFFDAPMAGEI